MERLWKTLLKRGDQQALLQESRKVAERQFWHSLESGLKQMRFAVDAHSQFSNATLTSMYGSPF
jgi:hypothetical protein